MVLINANATCHRERDSTCNVFNLPETQEAFHTINHAIYYSVLFSWYLEKEIVALYAKMEGVYWSN